MAGAGGFPRTTRYLPIPAPLLGQLLQDISSTVELKCFLRLLGLIQRRRSQRLWLTLEELLGDPILLNGLAQEPDGAQNAIRRGIEQAAQRGTVLLSQPPKEDPSKTLVLVNDEAGRRALAKLWPGARVPEPPETPSREPDVDRPNIFTLYEENIGPLTPLLAEELEEAERTYPWPWIQESFLEAVTRNHRSWRYIARILERWGTEGRNDGEPGRRTKKADPKEYLRRYGNLSA